MPAKHPGSWACLRLQTNASGAKPFSVFVTAYASPCHPQSWAFRQSIVAVVLQLRACVPAAVLPGERRYNNYSHLPPTFCTLASPAALFPQRNPSMGLRDPQSRGFGDNLEAFQSGDPHVAQRLLCFTSGCPGRPCSRSRLSEVVSCTYAVPVLQLCSLCEPGALCQQDVYSFQFSLCGFSRPKMGAAPGGLLESGEWWNWQTRLDGPKSC